MRQEAEGLPMKLIQLQHEPTLIAANIVVLGILLLWTGWIVGGWIINWMEADKDAD